MLAPNPAIALREQLTRRATARFSREPASWESVEEGVALAYEAVGLVPPASVVHCDGPLQLATALTRARSGTRTGANLRKQVFNDPLNGALAAAKAQWREVLDTDVVLGEPGNLAPDRLSANEKVSLAVDAAAARVVNRAFRRRWIRLRSLILGQGMPPLADFTDVSIGPSQLLSIGRFECFQETMRWDEELPALRGLRRLARNSGWIVPCEHVCFLADRPARISTDEQGRLHSAEGPAIVCKDGWDMWAWKGVEVPAWMIVRPERVTVEAIDAEIDPVVRRCMIDIMTPARFIAAGRATRVAEDEAGMLWRAVWSYRGVRHGSWTAVEVVDGTADRSGARKRYVLPVPSRVNSPREAVAWTYGMTAEEYAKLDLRT